MGRYLKDVILICGAVALCLLSITGGASQVEDRENPRVMEKIETMRNWRLMDVLNLSQERAQKLFITLREFDLKRRKLVQERRELRQKLARAAKGGSVDGDIRAIADRYLAIGLDLARLRSEELRSLRTQLSPQEEAKYLLFMERFNQEIMRMISRAKHERGLRKRYPPAGIHPQPPEE